MNDYLYLGALFLIAQNIYLIIQHNKPYIEPQETVIVEVTSFNSILSHFGFGALISLIQMAWRVYGCFVAAETIMFVSLIATTFLVFLCAVFLKEPKHRNSMKKGLFLAEIMITIIILMKHFEQFLK